MATAGNALAQDSKSDAKPLQWISVTEAARILQRSRVAIYHYIESGLLRDRRIGERGWRSVSSEDVNKLLKRREVDSRNAAR
jgi:predicted site-specific integrase-resolvase